MKEKEIVTILSRIAANFTELAQIMQDSHGTEKKEPAKKAEKAKIRESAPVREETAKASEAEQTEKIEFDTIRSILAEKAANGCRQRVKDLLKEYSLSCLSDIESHPELFAEILMKAREW